MLLIWYILLIAILLSFVLLRTPILKEKPLAAWLLYIAIICGILSISFTIYYMHYYLGDRDLTPIYIRLFHVSLICLLSSLFVNIGRKITL